MIPGMLACRRKGLKTAVEGGPGPKRGASSCLLVPGPFAVAVASARTFVSKAKIFKIKDAPRGAFHPRTPRGGVGST